ncbi:uncharacterized protein [Argopecten irradians]|uniref:uncharacterized protein isoform X2 n=1 Tax=Argopecten irradians TaxID=31199 RepID=UPI0037227420
MEVSNIKQALRVNRMKSAKAIVNFADICTFDIVPTPPKEPKPETTKMLRHRGVRAQKFKIYDAKSAQEPGFEPDRLIDHIYVSRTGSKDSYCPQNSTKYAYNDVKTSFSDMKANESLNIAVKNMNPIRYPAPGPREQLAPSPFPVNKNRLAPVVDPRKNAVPKTPRPGPIKGASSSVVDWPSMTLLPEAFNNSNPIRYPAPGPRELLVPSPFPIDKNRLAPVVNPKKNAVPKTTRAGPHPLKAVHMPIFSDKMTMYPTMLSQ